MQRAPLVLLATIAVLAVTVNAALSRAVHRRTAPAMSPLEIGTSFAVPALTRVAGPASISPVAGGCRVYVVVALNCPHCHVAARRGQSSAGRAAVTWVTPDTGAGLAAFARELPHTDALVTSSAFHTRLKARGVPAAVLLDSAAHIRLIWAYDGTSNAAFLGDVCNGRAQPATRPAA